MTQVTVIVGISTNSSIESDDEFLFLISIFSIKIKNETCCVSDNSCYLNVLYCRPHKFFSPKNSPQLIETEVQSIKNYIANLQIKYLIIGGHEILIEYVLLTAKYITQLEIQLSNLENVILFVESRQNTSLSKNKLYKMEKLQGSTKY